MNMSNSAKTQTILFDKPRSLCIAFAQPFTAPRVRLRTTSFTRHNCGMFPSSSTSRRRVRVRFDESEHISDDNHHNNEYNNYSYGMRRIPMVLNGSMNTPGGGSNSGGGGGGSVNGGNGGMSSEKEEAHRVWLEALEELLVEALRTYYQGTPLFSEAEFNTLRDELEHLGLAQVRLHNMEKIWVQATSARDFDRRIRQEFDLSEDDLTTLKNRLLVKGFASRPTADGPSRRKPTPKKYSSESTPSLPPSEKYLADASEIKAVENVNERIKWFLFSDASEERFKIMLLYLPAVVMSFVTASVLTILFALLDGEMRITVTAAGRFRLGILSYVVVALTFWFSNQVTPVMLDYLDLGQPILMRGACPICGAAVSCLFTGAARYRDERKCRVCGATVGFNRRWSKTYLVSPPGGQPVQQPD